MPLDDTGRIIDPPTIALLDPLARIGITPVPDDEVRRYKKVYRAVWVKQFGATRQGPFVWKTVHFETWRKQEAYRRIRKAFAEMSVERMLESVTLKDFLAAPLRFDMRSSDITAPPKELANLARFVERSVKEATFSVDYFDTDPVLNVHYGDQTACLGIWDHGDIVAIADHPIAHTPSTGFLATIRRTLFHGGWWGR